jgi:hypothetical protein
VDCYLKKTNTRWGGADAAPAPFVGQIAEMLLFRQGGSAGSDWHDVKMRRKLERYLSAKWGLGIPNALLSHGEEMHMGAQSLVQSCGGASGCSGTLERARFTTGTYTASLAESVPGDLLLPDTFEDESAATQPKRYEAVDRAAAFMNKTEDLQLRLWLKADDVDGEHTSHA